MSDDTPPPAAKKKGGKRKLVIAAAALAVIGGGAAAGFYVMGGTAEAGAAKVDENRPQLVLRHDAEADAHAPDRTKDGAPDPRKYQVSYYPIEQGFTSNLRDSDGFVQVGIGLSTFYDEKVQEAFKNDEMPIRSAVLMVLADQDAFTITTPEGKKALQKQLKAAVNDVLVKREGFGGVDDVYFTSFIIQ